MRKYYYVSFDTNVVHKVNGLINISTACLIKDNSTTFSKNIQLLLTTEEGETFDHIHSVLTNYFELWLITNLTLHEVDHFYVKFGDKITPDKLIDFLELYFNSYQTSTVKDTFEKMYDKVSESVNAAKEIDLFKDIEEE